MNPSSAFIVTYSILSYLTKSDFIPLKQHPITTSQKYTLERMDKMQHRQHAHNQIIYVTNSAYDELQNNRNEKKAASRETEKTGRLNNG
ncbi:hypothetical protein WQ57_17255 [Mesobacillus campisalis]|uniref:Uncharacterized protein n=1 Tax=Mesobacillus campisalis TaxID=1408103 RepID=A0A0M2SQH3_9BACI|nr:hypothetical protein WQ57_17255 [Mesobacillus campisalis]